MNKYEITFKRTDGSLQFTSIYCGTYHREAVESAKACLEKSLGETDLEVVGAVKWLGAT